MYYGAYVSVCHRNFCHMQIVVNMPTAFPSSQLLRHLLASHFARRNLQEELVEELQ